MHAIILVGGKGTRLRPLTYETPKQMLPLAGVPTIERVLGGLFRHGITSATLSLGYLPDRFLVAYPDNVISRVNVDYAVEPEPLDTAGAIRFAATYSQLDETFLVVNGDVVTDCNVTRLMAFHRERHARATIALHPVEDPSHFGVVATNEDGRVTDFIEKPTLEEAPSNLINAGLYVFEPDVLDEIEPDSPVSVERSTFPRLAAQGTLFALADDAYWLDTGTPQAFIRANVDILRGRRAEEEDVDVIDGVWCHPSATVDPSARVRLSVIDRGCVVGPGATLDEAVLLPGSVVQAGATVRSSIVGPAAVIGSDSVLGATCVVGANEHVAPMSRLSGDVRLGGV